MADVEHRAAVLGSPIAHSLSPALHTAAYAALGLDGWVYTAAECDEARLARFLDRCGPEWAGLSLTMPLKRAVMPLLDLGDAVALATGSANTVIFSLAGRQGYNTDASGMVAALAEAGITSPAGATILGAGATACSAVAAMGELGLKSNVTVLARDPSRARDLLTAADRLHVSVTLGPLSSSLREGDLLISTLPAGAADFFAERPAQLAPAAAVLDVVYNPWPTRLAQAAAAAGVPVAGGFDLLLHQAARQVELMTGKRPAPLEAMRAAGQAALARS
jgi:shikimate dehydrogenase